MLRKALFAAQGWYPANRAELLKMIEESMPGTPRPVSDIKGIISPHAGYAYSLKTALHAYVYLKDRKTRRVFVLGPSHRSECGGKAVLSDFQGFETPLGVLPADVDQSRQIARENKEDFKVENLIHSGEHSLEMQMSLIFKMLGTVPVVPVILPPGEYETYSRIGNFLGNYLKDDDFVIISSDLSHFPSKRRAEEIDRDSQTSWETMDPEQVWQTEQKWQNSSLTDCAMCGISAITSGMTALKKAFGELKLLNVHHSTSAEVSGDDTRVVGYGSAVIYKE